MFSFEGLFTTSVVSSFIVVVIIWILRNWLAERLTQSIKYEYDKSLLEIKHSSEAKIAEIAAEVKLYESRQQNLISGVMSNFTQKELLLAEKKFEALDVIWKKKLQLDKSLLSVSFSSMINWDTVGTNDPPKKDFVPIAKMISSHGHFDNIDFAEANVARLYVSESVWLYFKAYQMIFMDSMMRIKLLELKQPMSMMNPDALLNFLKDILPEKAAEINYKGIKSIPDLAKIVSDRLFESLQADFRNDEHEHQSIIRKNDLIRKVDEIQQQQLSASQKAGI